MVCCQSITWTNVDLWSIEFRGILLNPVSQAVLKVSMRKMSLKNTLLHLPEAIELKY